jgi:uncharacterized tellurite resistance protein B-like protein
MTDVHALTAYPDDSLDALLRVVVMFAVTDGDVAASEVEVLDRLGVLKALGADHPRLTHVARQYFDDLQHQAALRGHVDLNDDAWLDRVLAPVRSHGNRLLLARLLLVMARADGRFADPELAVLRRLLERWDLTLEDLGSGAPPEEAGNPG